MDYCREQRQRIGHVEVKNSEAIKHYWRNYRRRVRFVLLLSQLLIGLTIITAVIYFGLLSFTTLYEFVALGLIILFIVTTNYIITMTLIKPIGVLSDAIANVTGENNDRPLPNPNRLRGIQFGLKPLLSSLYSLASNTTGPSQDDDNLIDGAETQLLQSVNDTPVGVALFHTDGSIAFASKSVPTRMAPGGAQSLEMEFYTDESIQQWTQDCHSRTVRADKTWVRTASKPSGQPDRKLFDIHASYRKGSDTPVLAFFIDRTEAYTPEEEDLNFIAFAAHELRGPITVIRGYLDTLLDEMSDTVTPDQHELFDRLNVSASRLSSYINNILNSAKYDQRHLALRLSETRITDIYHTIADDMALRASSQHRVLSVTLPHDLPTVAADLTSVSEVFSNIIDNAIKYSNEGGLVEVSAEVSGNFVEVFVKDNGIGMPSNVVSNLFHKFYRSHRSRETVAGTGIGLYISKGIIESHGGTMEVQSVEHEGSTFSFTLPIYASVADKLQDADGANDSLIKTHRGGWIKNHGAYRG